MLNEILQKIGLDESTQTLGFKCTILGKKGVYIEGISKVNQFDKEKVVLQAKNGIVEIHGKNLEIKTMSKSDAVVSGEIEKVVTGK